MILLHCHSDGRLLWVNPQHITYVTTHFQCEDETIVGLTGGYAPGSKSFGSVTESVDDVAAAVRLWQERQRSATV